MFGQKNINALATTSGVPKKQTRFLLVQASVLCALAVLLVFVCSLFANPRLAFAQSYEIPDVTINAAIQANGNLEVEETRTYELDGDFSAVWRSFDNLPNGSFVRISNVEITQDGQTLDLPSVPFELEWRTDGGPGYTSYSFDSPQQTIYVFFDAADEDISITIDYTVVDAVSVYQDIGELYWQFIGSDWDVDSRNVSCNITLPAQTGTEIIPGENVYAWGHGPLDATVEIQPNGTVEYYVPRVDAESFAEARIALPASWFSEVEATDSNAHPNESRLESVLTEEQRWSDQANAQRISALMSLLLATAVALIALIWGFISFRRYGKELEPNFTEEYWRDVPLAGEHPAVISRVCNFDEVRNEDFTATIMHLINEGALLINKGSYVWENQTVEDYYLTRVDSYIAPNEIDRKALSILFDVVGNGQKSIWMSSIALYAKDHPEEYQLQLDQWQGLVTARTIQGEYIEAYSKSKKYKTISVSFLVLAACFVVSFMSDNPLAMIPGIVGCIPLFIMGRFMDRRTQKGADVYARAMALKKWLTDFSSLNERPVLDIKIWGEFMVYAYLFGVAEEVLDELRNAVPELFADDAVVATNSFYVPWWVVYSHHSYAGVQTNFANSIGSAFATATAELTSAATGNFSSGGGFGGGFSGGGGGGFGGGGGAR